MLPTAPVGYTMFSQFGGLPDHYWSQVYSGNYKDQGHAVKALTELYTNDYHTGYLTPDGDIERLVRLAEDESHRKIILGVLKERLDQPWPCNYKALDIMHHMPPKYLVPYLDKIAEHASASNGVLGWENLRLKASAFVDTVRAEKSRIEAEDFEKRQKEMSAMWSGLWANAAPKPAYPAHVYYPHTASQPVPYPYTPPGLTTAPVTWVSTAPEGWKTVNSQPPPPHQPFSRVTFHALQPDPPKGAKDPPLQPVVYMPPRAK